MILKGVWHHFQYLDHRFNFYWDLWEKVKKRKFELKIFHKNWFYFFQIQNFTPFRCPRQPNFTLFRCPRQPNFTPFRCPRQPNFTPFWCPRQPNFTQFGCPRQLLWTPLEGWGKTGVWQKVSLLKLRNSAAPSTLYSVQCTVYTLKCILYIVHCKL